MVSEHRVPWRIPVKDSREGAVEVSVRAKTQQNTSKAHQCSLMSRSQDPQGHCSEIWLFNHYHHVPEHPWHVCRFQSTHSRPRLHVRRDRGPKVCLCRVYLSRHHAAGSTAANSAHEARRPQRKACCSRDVGLEMHGTQTRTHGSRRSWGLHSPVRIQRRWREVGRGADTQGHGSARYSWRGDNCNTMVRNWPNPSAQLVCSQINRYGGELLGPARFAHIEACATEVAKKFKDGEELAELRTLLESLDDLLSNLRDEYKQLTSHKTPSACPSGSEPDRLEHPPASRKPSYAALDIPKARRLIRAREGAISSVKILIAKVRKDTQPSASCSPSAS